MSKPQWLKDQEGYKPPKKEYHCYECVNYCGQRIGETKHKGVEKVEVWECKIHPGCFNTKYSIRCNDFMPK